jgi:hypothetical protein
MNSFAILGDKVKGETREAYTRAKVGDYGISFNLALGLTSHGNRYEREPDFGDCPRRQERGCHPCSRISVCTCVWVNLLLRGKTAARELRFSVPRTKTDMPRRKPGPINIQSHRKKDIT